MKLRNLEPGDYDILSSLLDEWWGGRPVRKLLPRLFFEHFQPSSFALIDENAIVGFLVGFRSQTDPRIAYVHFVGIDPAYRSRGLGRRLYERFFEIAADLGCTEAQSITSPINEASICFHQQLGFQIGVNPIYRTVKLT